MTALIVEVCQSGFVCDVITSYTTLNSSPEKLQHIYQEAKTESICWKMSELCFSVLHCCSMFQTSAKNKVLTAAQGGALISCVGMLPQQQLLSYLPSEILSFFRNAQNY